MEEVYIAHCERAFGTPWQYQSGDVAAVASELYEASSALRFDWPRSLSGKTVLVKLNLVRGHKELSFTTDLRVVEAILQLLRDSSARKIWVGDNASFDASTAQIGDQLGIARIAERYGATFSSFDDDEQVPVRHEAAYLLKDFLIPQVALDSEAIINVPKLKTHTLTQVSLALKNHHGLVSKRDRLRYHRNDIDDKLIDIYSYFAPKELLQIIDGLWAIEGQGPCDQGTQIPNFNCLVLGSNAVSVDAVGSALMGFDPLEIPAVRIGNWRGLGTAVLDQIKVLGTPVIDLQRHFRRPICAVAGMYKGIQAFEFSPCRGCVSHAMVSLDIMTDLGEIQYLPNDLVLILGIPPDEFVPVWRNVDIWLVGCAASVRERFLDCGNVYAVDGCPPWLADLRNKMREVYCIA